MKIVTMLGKDICTARGMIVAMSFTTEDMKRAGVES